MVSASRFKGKSFISMRDYSREEIDFILGVADEMMPLEAKGTDMAKGKVMGVLFFEPSTRTRLSFCLLYTSPSPRDRTRSRMPSSA